MYESPIQSDGCSHSASGTKMNNPQFAVSNSETGIHRGEVGGPSFKFRVWKLKLQAWANRGRIAGYWFWPSRCRCLVPGPPHQRLDVTDWSVGAQLRMVIVGRHAPRRPPRADVVLVQRPRTAGPKHRQWTVVDKVQHVHGSGLEALAPHTCTA